MTTAADPASIVEAFCDAWTRLDLDEITGYLTPDAHYHNIPVDPVDGVDAIRAFIAGFTAGVSQVAFEIRHIVAAGDVVLTERLDVFRFDDGRTIELPVMGTFELRDGKIAAWRDYFDLQQYMSQLSPG
jgi:limonene-1,2-epoxide hydrolase